MVAKVQILMNCEDKDLYSLLLRSAQPCKLECKFCKSGLNAQRHVTFLYSPVWDVTASHSFLYVRRRDNEKFLVTQKKRLEKENSPVLTL